MATFSAGPLTALHRLGDCLSASNAQSRHWKAGYDDTRKKSRAGVPTDRRKLDETRQSMERLDKVFSPSPYRARVLEPSLDWLVVHDPWSCFPTLDVF